MRRPDVIAALQAAEPEIRAFGVGRLYLFGSVARDEAGAGSDLDVFVEPATPALLDLVNYMGVYERLRRAVPGVAIGFTTRDGLSPHVRAAVERDALRVF